MKNAIIIISVIILSLALWGLVKREERIYFQPARESENPAIINDESGEGEPNDQSSGDGPTEEENKSNRGASEEAAVSEPPKNEPNLASLLNVPFTSQAPFGDWKDLRQEDGCEEASSLMAILWTKNTNAITQDYALSKILDISKYEEEKYGSYRDTGAKDTIERILKGYFGYDKAYLKNNASIDDIKNELALGNLIIAPVNGQKLKNPYYSGAGPERHMLVIKGYDPEKNQFITNDPGTRRGESYRYAAGHFYDSIRDYATGSGVPITDNEKNIIIVKK